MLLIDLIFGTITLASMLGGLRNGFTKSFLSLLSWIFALQISYLAYPYLEKLFFSNMEAPIYATLLGQITTFILVLCGFGILNNIILNILGSLRMGFIDRALGLILGIIRSIIICGTIYLSVIMLVNLNLHTKSLLDNNHNKLPQWLVNSYSQQVALYIKKAFNQVFDGRMQINLQNIYDDISIKGANDRFIQSMTEQMMQLLSEKDIISINNFKKEYGQQFSETEMSKIIAGAVLQKYKSGFQEDQTENYIPKKKIERLEEILAKNR